MQQSNQALLLAAGLRRDIDAMKGRADEELKRRKQQLCACLDVNVFVMVGIFWWYIAL